MKGLKQAPIYRDVLEYNKHLFTTTKIENQ